MLGLGASAVRTGGIVCTALAHVVARECRTHNPSSPTQLPPRTISSLSPTYLPAPPAPNYIWSASCRGDHEGGEHKEHLNQVAQEKVCTYRRTLVYIQ